MKIKPKKREFKLSERDIAIMECIASGFTTQDIAQELKMAVSTVNMALLNLYNRTNTIGRAHLIAWAYQNKIL